MQHVIDDRSYPQSQVGEPRILNDLLAHVLVLICQKRECQLWDSILQPFGLQPSSLTSWPWREWVRCGFLSIYIIYSWLPLPEGSRVESSFSPILLAVFWIWDTHLPVSIISFSSFFTTWRGMLRKAQGSKYRQKLIFAISNFIWLIEVSQTAMAEPHGRIISESWDWAQWIWNSFIGLIKLSGSASVLLDPCSRETHKIFFS